MVTRVGQFTVLPNVFVELDMRLRSNGIMWLIVGLSGCSQSFDKPIKTEGTKPVEQRSEAEQEAYAESIRVVARGGGFSIVPQLRWHVSQQRTDQGYSVLEVDSSTIFPANIRVSHIDLAVSLDEYVQKEREMMSQKMTVLSEGEPSNFETRSGIRGKKIWIERDQELIGDKGRSLVRIRQSFYFFENGKRKYGIMATVAVVEAAELEAAINACVKTFRFEP